MMNKKNASTARPAVFLDRDGTVMVEKDFLGDPAGVELLPRAAEAIQLLNQRGYLAIVVTNQSGVARGYINEDDVRAVNARLQDVLQRAGAKVDEIFYCPHFPDGVIPAYRMACDCRKPRTGLARRALEMFEIDMSRSAMIGDRAADIEFGHNLGLPSILVLTGYGHAEKERMEDEFLPAPDFIAADLREAVNWILARTAEDNRTA